jgi:hypothetical protein
MSESQLRNESWTEYVPFAETFPWLYRLTPLPGQTVSHVRP